MSVEATFNKTPLRILALSVYTDFLQKLHYYKLLNTGNKWACWKKNLHTSSNLHLYGKALTQRY
jgi:hypothetical protein